MFIICSAKRVVISSCGFRNPLIPLSSAQRSSEDGSEEQEFSGITKTPWCSLMTFYMTDTGSYPKPICGICLAHVASDTQRNYALTVLQTAWIVLRFYANGAFLYSVGDSEHLRKNIECSYS